MQTTITQRSPVEYELEISAPAEELAPQLNKALRAQQRETQMKGFRQGKVPMSIIKKRYGQALAFQAAEEKVQEAYNEVVLDADEYDVLGQPTITKLEVDVDEDLEAVIRFGVRPEIELKDLSETEVEKVTYEVTEEDVDQEVERLRKQHADLMPVEDEPAQADDYVLFDLQELDPTSGTPIIGKRDEDQAFFLDAPQVDQNPMLQELRDALVGATAGDTVRFTFEHDQAHGEHAEGETHAHLFEVELQEVKRRDLPELDDAFAGEVSDDQVTTLEELRDAIRNEMEQAWEQQVNEYVENQIVEKMLDLHTVPVPPSVTEMYLDAFVEDVKQRNDDELPPDFDETAFRHANKSNAEQQARWMLLRDKVVEEYYLEVHDEDLDGFFARQAEREPQLTVDQLRQFYESMPRLMDQVRQRLLNEKVFDTLMKQFTVTEKDRETLEQEMEEAQARQAAQAQAQAQAEAAAPTPGSPSPLQP